MKVNRKAVIIAFLGLLFVGFVLFRISQRESSNEASRRPAPLVATVNPTRENLVRTLTYNGDVLPFQQAYIYAKVTGTLERVFVDMGDFVRQGRLLATIDSTELVQQVLQTSATYENALINYNRTNDLAAQNLLAKQDLDNAQAAMTVAKANYDNAVTKLSYARITAPFSGIITKRNLDPGAVVTSNNSTLFTLMDLEHVKVITSIPEKDVPTLERVKSAQVTVDALPGKAFRGEVSRLSQAIDLNTRTMPVEIDIENASHQLKPGMFATVTLSAEEHKNALVLPIQAILTDDQGQFVFVAEGGKVKKDYVKPGWEISNRLEIVGGLTGGEDVVVSGQQQLREGVAVRVVGQAHE
jgi:membrane fusion protein (multidrug efflux system)